MPRNVKSAGRLPLGLKRGLISGLFRLSFPFKNRARPPVFIVATPRSGSYLLRSYLNSVPGISLAGEVLNPDIPLGIVAGAFSHDEVLRHILLRAAPFGDGIGGAKFMISQLRQHALSLDDVGTFFPGARFIILYRRHLLDQWISMKIASISGHWRWSRDFSMPASLHADPGELLRYCEQTRADYRGIFAFDGPRNGSIVLDYESLCAFPQKIFDDVVFPLLGLPPCPIKTDMRKQVTRPVREIIENYEELGPLLDDGSLLQEYSSS
ncbi:MAG: hypothetical protein A2Z40_03420 [Deltaproteobacteria bacterium RBG_19FT_COMBO_60_16]|nr:MAG: hypothetical protein A2Z40_03420 [Deltaproteobacteria bacterium RBG_19FT_COMBO_60_16]